MLGGSILRLVLELEPETANISGAVLILEPPAMAYSEGGALFETGACDPNEGAVEPKIVFGFTMFNLLIDIVMCASFVFRSRESRLTRHSETRPRTRASEQSGSGTAG